LGAFVASSVGHDVRQAVGERVVDWERVKGPLHWGQGTQLCCGGVSGYSRQEVAHRAGVDPDYLDRLVELGILIPDAGDAFSPGDVLRARWVRSLEQAGVPLDRMAAAVRDGALSFSFMDVPAFDQFAGLSGTTFQELSAQTGIPLQLLMVVREAGGFAEPRPEDHVHDNELSVVPLIQLQLSEGFRPVVIERWLRVYGDSLRRIAETETAWWRSEVVMPILASGTAEAEMLQARPTSGRGWLPSSSRPWWPSTTGSRNIPGARAPSRPSSACWKRRPAPPGGPAPGNVLPGHHRVHAADRGAGGRGRRGPGGPACWPGPAVGPGARGDAGEVAGRRDDVLLPGASSCRAGRPGDGGGSRAPGPATGTCRDPCGAGHLPGGDYFGRTVNLAARIAEYARPGEVLVSQEVVDAAEGGSVSFVEIGPVELKGVPGTLRLHTARRNA
jgi:adenylate cyclase